MGITAMIPDMTIGQLTQEASTRWGEIWDPNATRMRILLLCPRKERKMMELHGDMVEHGQPVMAVFHRPRAEAPLLEEQGFDTRAASFQFVDISTPDLGPWMQHMVSNEGWIRGSIEIASTPFSVGLPSQRPFETERTLYFRHPSLPALERYYLPFPVESLPGKCFVSLPRRAAAEMARQQAEVLGIGRLEKPAPEPEPAPPEPPAPKVEQQPASVETPEEPATPAAEPAEIAEEIAVPLPPSASPQDNSTNEAIPEQIPLPTQAEAPPSEEGTSHEPQEDIALPEPTPEPEPDRSDLEMELRTFFQELIDAGVEPSEFMDDARWEDLNERALAEHLETWPILLEMTAMGQ